VLNVTGKGNIHMTGNIEKRYGYRSLKQIIKHRRYMVIRRT
jgi:hypothetical protein